MKFPRPFDGTPAILRGWFWFLQAAVLVAAAWFVFAPAFHGGWLWDDFEIQSNLTLHSGPGLERIWIAPASPDYYPLEATVRWVQWHLWHEHLLGYHLTNVGLHLLSAFLIWRLLKKLGVRLAWLGGLLFVAHPLAVESVAWVAELKNTLSLPPLLLAVSAFIDYDRAADAPAPGAARPWRHLLRSILWFLASMLCKTSVAMLPVMLLVYVWWRRGRIGKRDLWNTAPFFAVSLILGLITFYFQLNRAIGGWRLPSRTGIGRIADGGFALAFYFWKCLLPAGLMPIYPPWSARLPPLLGFLPWLALAATAGILLARRTPWSRTVLFGFGWFVVNLLPVIGFVPMSYQHIAPVADHFAYVALVGMVGLAAAGLSGVGKALDADDRGAQPLFAALRTCLAAAAAAGIGGLLVASHRYAGVFKDQETEWTYNLRQNPRSPMVYLNLAYVQNQAGRKSEAIDSFNKAIQLDPQDPDIENGVGDLMAESELVAQAIPHYQRALELDPARIETRRSLATVLYKAGRAAEAIELYRQVLLKTPNDSETEANLGKALGDLGRQSESIAHFKRALEIDPRNAEAQNSLGLSLASSGRVEEGITHLREALRLNPDSSEVHNNLGFALASLGRQQDAIVQFEEALRLKPKFGQAHNNLGFALAATGRREEAIKHFEEALSIEPNDPKAHYNLSVLLEMANRRPEAIVHLKEAIRLKPDFADARSSLSRLEAIEAVGTP
ncbi:MAG: tetratricopeptide repeat protein [Opitutaceae bacterium]|jgi:tetratricopeptide (TPR) repeat protein